MLYQMSSVIVKGEMNSLSEQLKELVGYFNI